MCANTGFFVFGASCGMPVLFTGALLLLLLIAVNMNVRVTMAMLV